MLWNEVALLCCVALCKQNYCGNQVSLESVCQSMAHIAFDFVAAAAALLPEAHIELQPLDTIDLRPITNKQTSDRAIGFGQLGSRLSHLLDGDGEQPMRRQCFQLCLSAQLPASSLCQLPQVSRAMARFTWVVGAKQAIEAARRLSVGCCGRSKWQQRSASDDWWSLADGESRLL